MKLQECVRHSTTASDHCQKTLVKGVLCSPGPLSKYWNDSHSLRCKGAAFLSCCRCTTSPYNLPHKPAHPIVFVLGVCERLKLWPWISKSLNLVLESHIMFSLAALTWDVGCAVHKHWVHSQNDKGRSRENDRVENQVRKSKISLKVPCVCHKCHDLTLTVPWHDWSIHRHL